MKSVLTSLSIAISSLMVALPSQAAIVVLFNPSSLHVAAGDFFDVSAVVSGLGAGASKEIVAGFDLNVFFDSTLMKGLGVDENDIVFGAASDRLFGPATGVGTGSLGLEGLSLLLDSDLQALQADSFTLATFHFLALMDGVTTLQFGSSVPFESNLSGGLDALGNSPILDAQFGTACVSVGAGACKVPEPSSYGLLGLALAGLLIPSMRQRRGEATLA